MPVGMFCIESNEKRIKEPGLESVSHIYEDALTCVYAYMHACVLGEASSPSVLESSSLPVSGVRLLWSAVPFTLDSGGRGAEGKALEAASRPRCPPRKEDLASSPLLFGTFWRY